MNRWPIRDTTVMADRAAGAAGDAGVRGCTVLDEGPGQHRQAAGRNPREGCRLLP